MDKFLGSLTASMAIQGLIASIAIVGTFYLVINKMDIPDVVMILDGAITAFYFSNVTASNIAKAVTDGR